MYLSIYLSIYHSLVISTYMYIYIGKYDVYQLFLTPSAEAAENSVCTSAEGKDSTNDGPVYDTN